MRSCDVYAARQRTRSWVVRTPLVQSAVLSKLIGGEVWLKLENRQVTGSFKIRGATNKLSLLSDRIGDGVSSPLPLGIMPWV